MAANVNDSVCYTLTPEGVFSPSVAMAKHMYRIGSQLPGCETRQLEYKIGSYALNNLEEHVRKYGSGFLNSNGGTLVMGVSDDGVVVGVNISSHMKNTIRRRIKDEFTLFKPPVTSDLYLLDFVPTDDIDKYVIELHVRAGAQDEIYVGRDNKMFLKRDGSVQGPLWPRNIKDIVIEKFVKTLNKTDSDSCSLIKLAEATPVAARK